MSFHWSLSQSRQTLYWLLTLLLWVVNISLKLLVSLWNILSSVLACVCVYICMYMECFETAVLSLIHIRPSLLLHYVVICSFATWLWYFPALTLSSLNSLAPTFNFKVKWWSYFLLPILGCKCSQLCVWLLVFCLLQAIDMYIHFFLKLK